MKPFYQTRLSDGRKIELSEAEYNHHLHVVGSKLAAESVEMGVLFQNSNRTIKDQLIRSHLELGGHLKGKK